MSAPRDAGELPLAASVVIATRGRPEMVHQAVLAILAAKRVPSEILVVDQSDLANQELARLRSDRGCAVRYVHSATRGTSRARNVGLRLASHEAVVILDDDILVDEDCIGLLVAATMRGGGQVVATGRLLAAPAERPGLVQPPAALVTRSARAVFRGRQPLQVVPGPNISLPRAVMLEIAGYDERLGPGTRFPAGEDHDLSLRLLDAGCEVRHVPEAVAWHRTWRSPRAAVRLRWGYARGVGAFYAKHASMRDRHALLRAIREVSTRLRRGATSLFASPTIAAAELLTLAGLLAGALEWTVRYRLRLRSSPRGM